VSGAPTPSPRPSPDPSPGPSPDPSSGSGARRLSPGAVERLLDLGEPLGERPELGAVDLERYELKQVIGRGGTGVVYEAWDRELDRRVALKLLSQPAGRSPEARQRFLREARAAARLVHPHIAAVYDATPEAIASIATCRRSDSPARSPANTPDCPTARAIVGG